MVKTLKLLVLFSSLLFFAVNGYADSFVINKIQVKGLQRVSRATFFSYLPIKKGDTLSSGETNKIIQSLYKTDFFANITLARDVNTLLINVQERPTISAVDITGNKQIPEDKLNDALSKLGLVKGRFLDHSILEEVRQALQNQYYATGRYNVSIKITQTKQTRNRVAIGIQVSEGAVAKIASIKILGNKAFPESEILDSLHMSTPSFTSFFTRKDEYSADKLQQSEQDIQTLYMDNGYVDIKINAAQVAITPDRKHVYITFKLNEGQQFHFSGFKLSGKLVQKSNELNQVVSVKKGNIFSRQDILNSHTAMISILGNIGYAYANVEPKPVINKKTKTVFIDFNVQPGRKYYIRHIRFYGNESTSEVALRKQLYELEGSLYSISDIHNSVYQLRQNTYINQQPPPQVIPVKVPGSNNLLDLDVKLAEKLSAEFQFQIGYSQAYGLQISTGITQSNFMGSGKTVGFNINSSAYQKSASFSYTNPYYTPDGVSRTISVSGTKTSSDQLSIAEYNTDQYGVNVNYGFPLSVYSNLNLGYGISRTILKKGGSFSKTVTNFINKYGDTYDQLSLTAGWSRQTTDRPILPTKGTKQSFSLLVSVPVDKHKLEYYKLSYTSDWYKPLNKYFTLHTHGTLGYGDGYDNMKELPFFQNYYAGGLGVQGLNRAYYPFSLGPRDSSGNQLGGNLLVSGNVSLILPDFFNTPTVRTSIFLDGGNVFNTNIGAYSFKFKNLRYSYGAQVQWWTPLNIPLLFSFAEPINEQGADQLDAFQFTIGTMY